MLNNAKWNRHFFFLKIKEMRIFNKSLTPLKKATLTISEIHKASLFTSSQYKNPLLLLTPCTHPAVHYTSQLDLFRSKKTLSIRPLGR